MTLTAADITRARATGDEAYRLAVDAGLLEEVRQPAANLRTDPDAPVVGFRVARPMDRMSVADRNLVGRALIGREVMIFARSHPKYEDTGVPTGRVIAVGELRTIGRAGEALVLIADGHPHRAAIITLAAIQHAESTPPRR